MDKLHLGVDTSNYTTSLSLVCDGKVISNVRRLLSVKDGEKGLRQSDAVFLHTKALPELSKELFSGVDMTDAKLFCDRIKPTFAVPLHCGMFDSIDMNNFEFKNKIVPEIYNEVILK